MIPQVFSKQRDVMVDARKRASESGLWWRASGEASWGVPIIDQHGVKRRLEGKTSYRR
jgi:hypothetical protein